MSISSRRALALTALIWAGSVVAIPAPAAFADCGGPGPTIDRVRDARGTAFTGRFVGFEHAEAGLQLLWLIDTVYSGDVPTGAFGMVGAECDPLVLQPGEEYLFATGAQDLAGGKASYANSVAWHVDGGRVELAQFLDIGNPPSEQRSRRDYPAPFRSVATLAEAVRLVAPRTSQEVPTPSSSPTPPGCALPESSATPGSSSPPANSVPTPGCSPLPPAPIVASVQLQPADAHRPLSLAVADATGKVRAVRAMSVDELAQLPLIRDQFMLVEASGSDVLVWWIGSPCESSGTLTVASESPQLSLDLQPRGDCDARAQLYGLVLEQDEPSDPSGWTVRYAPSTLAAVPSPVPNAQP